MIVFRQPDQVVDWHLAFFPVGKYRFAWLVPGRFKHVLAFGYSHPCRTWVAYDVTLLGTRLYVFPDGGEGLAALAALVDGATIVRPTCRNLSQLVATCRVRDWLGFWCVPAVRHLIRCRCGAATPAGLYRGLLAEGAEVVGSWEVPQA